jgi:hypothetical protein
VPTNCTCFPSYFLGFGGRARGGALYNQGRLTLVNCTLAGNKAKGGDGLYQSSVGGSAYGGAIFNGSNRVSLLNVTFASNSVAAGSTAAAGYFLPDALGASIAMTNGVVALTNSIFCAAVGQTNFYGPITDGGHNISTDVSPAFTSATSRKNVDPLLGPLTDNGGFTPTVALLPGSPAIDAGDDSACPATDQRGVARPKGASCDVGAFELAPRLSLTPAENGETAVNYVFQAHQTNAFSVSTNLFDWTALGTRVADSNGISMIELVDPERNPNRFYKAQSVPAE